MSSQPVVFRVKEQASETQLGSLARRVAVRSSPSREWRIRTIGGVITNTKGETIGLTVASLFGQRSRKSGGDSSRTEVAATTQDETDPAPSPMFSPGDVVKSKVYYGNGRKWALVYLESWYCRPNIIQVPNGFGESFVLSELPKPDSILEDEVWILTGRLGIVVGRRIEGEYWTVQLMNHSLTWNDCGSWAVGAASRNFLGIVEKVTDTQVFLLEAEKIFNEIKSDLQSELKLPTEDSTPRDVSETALEASYLPRGRDTSLWRTILCCCLIREISIEASDSSDDIRGARVGQIGKQEIYELPTASQQKWRKVEVDIQKIIQQTPTKLTHESTPVVFLRGFMVKNSPTAFIHCSSKSYAVQLRKAVRQSKVLDNSNFNIMIANTPIRPFERTNSSHDV